MNVATSSVRVIKRRPRITTQDDPSVFIGARVSESNFIRYHKAVVHALGTSGTMSDLIRNLLEDYSNKHGIK